jgi:hypothetical protein
MVVLLGIVVILGVLVIQGLVSALALAAAGPFVARAVERHSFWRNALITLSLILILLAGHLAQMAGWAMVFIAIGEFSEFAAALEHSAVNYSTLGYGDIVMSPHWRILGPLEAVSGTLAFGWTTAVLVNVVGRLVHAGHR